jgi:MFS family permease
VTPALSPRRHARHRKGVGGLPPAFWRISAAMSIGRMGMFVIPFLAYYLDKSRHLGATSVAIIIAGFGLGSTIGDPLGGYLADLFGRRLMIVLGNLAAAATYVYLGRADNVRSMAIAALAVGVCFDFWRPAAYAILHDAAENDAQRKRAMSLFFWIFNVATIAGCLGAGFLALEVGWIWLFYGNAAACVGFALVATFMVSGGRPGPKTRQSATVPRGAVGSLLIVSFLTLICMTAYNQSIYALPVRFAGDGIGPVEYAVIVIANPITVGIVQLTTQNRLERISSTVAFVIGTLLIGVGIGVTGMGHGFTVHGFHVSALVWFCSASVIWVLGEITIFGPGMTLVTDLAPPGKEASYTGLFLSTIGLSTITASAAGAWLIRLRGLQIQTFHLSGLPLLWAACAASGVLTSIGFLLLARPLKRRVELMAAFRESKAEPGDSGAPALIQIPQPEPTPLDTDGSEYPELPVPHRGF